MLQKQNKLLGKSPDYKIARSLTWRYLLALLLVASLSTAAWLSLHMVIAEQDSTALIVNISGRQRMLSQRTALFSNLLFISATSERESLRQELRQAIELMARSHTGLTIGDKQLGLPSKMSDRVRTMYFEGPDALDAQVSQYISSVKQLLELNDDQLKPGNALLAYITNTAPQSLLTALDKMVRQYQIEGEASVKQLQKLETIFWLMTLLLLIFEALLIFHPFLMRMKSVIARLELTSDELRLHQAKLDETIKIRTESLKRKSEELEESEEKFRLISTTAQDGIVIIDDKGLITFWNHAAERIFHYTVEEVIGKSLHELLAPEPQRIAANLAYEDFRNSGQGMMVGRTFETTALNKNRGELPIELSVSAFKFQDRWHALGIVRDITERKLAEQELQDSEERLRFVLEGAELGFWDWNITTGKVVRNEKWAAMLGYRYEELVETTRQWEDFVHPEDREKAWQSIGAAMQGRTSAHKMEYRMLHKDGSIRWILDQAKVIIKDSNGSPVRMCGIHTDVTERKLNESRLKLLQFSLDYAEEEIIWIDKYAKIFIANRAACKNLEYTQDELLKLSVYDVDPNFPLAKWTDHWQELKEKGSLRFETMQKTKLGKCFPTEVVANYLEYQGQEYNCAFIRDISERKRLEEELKVKANVDPLTGINNRRHFLEEAHREFSRALRYQHDLSMLMIDVDFFKRINDIHGHQAGDQVLMQISSALRINMRDIDIIGRMGGEEFAIILVQADSAKAWEVSQRLRSVVEETNFLIDEKTLLRCTISIGISVLKPTDGNIEEVLRNADDALYKAKNAGRNRVCD
jgi:diguanylate cyclase (GGDEF)-like protein/PAS domain S-box-containing protein